MNVDEKYWTWYKSPRGFKQVLQATYKDDLTDHKRIKEERIFSSKQDAESNLRRSG